MPVLRQRAMTAFTTAVRSLCRTRFPRPVAGPGAPERRPAVRPSVPPGRDDARSAPADESFDLNVVFSPTELDELIAALRRVTDLGPVAPDTPAGLENALRKFVCGLGHTADIDVIRNPAALISPECWRINVSGLDRGARDAVEPMLVRNRRSPSW
jgi:hypothetical protein